MAIVFDEIKEAGAKVIALDMLLAEPQLPFSVKQPDGTYKDYDDDQTLADCFRRANNILLPASAGQFAETVVPPLNQAMLRHLSADLEITSEDLQAKLIAEGFSEQEVIASVRDDLLFFQEHAMIQKLTELVRDKSLTDEQLVAKVAPKIAASGQRSDTILLAEQKLAVVRAMQELDRFQTLATSQTPPLLRAQTHTLVVPVARLTKAAQYSGYVDFVPVREDPIVRSVPLFAEFRGKLYPHMVLSTVCAALGIQLDKVEVQSDRVVLPRASGGNIEIPTRTVQSAKFGTISTFLDIPWFGQSGEYWWSMYDYTGGYKRAERQESLKNVWRVQQLRESIERNERLAREALMFMYVDVLSQDETEMLKLLSDLHPDFVIRRMLEDTEFIGPAYVELKKLPDKELRDPDRRLIASYEALKFIQNQNSYFRDRIAAEKKELHEKLNGKIVLVGWTAAGQYDYYPTPLHPQCPGVVIQGAAINAILSQQFWYQSPHWLAPVITGLIGGLVTIFVAFLPSYRALVAMLVLLVAYIVINGVIFFDYGNYLVPAAGAITAAIVVWGILTLYRYIYESAERTRITKRFSGYVDPAIVNLLLEDPDKIHFDGEVREMTVVFTDLAGFTTISEKLQERTVPLLNDYMSRMMPIIRKNGGTWNKFLGDGIMFFYNAPVENPHHARDAVETVLQMQKEVEQFNVELLKQQLPKVAMRAGIVTGKMIAGDAGSIGANHEASDYTVLGDNVNLAARLESANKALGSRTLVVQDTIDQMGGTFLARPIAKLQVVGKTQGVMTWEPLCLKSDATDKEKRLVELTTQVVENFTQRKFKECIAAAEKLQDEFGSSKFTALYLGQAREFLLGPPDEDWDGTIVLESK